MEFNVPKSPRMFTKTMRNFLGVDFTSVSPSDRRASNIVNLINNDGFLETRPGYSSLGHEFVSAINGIWNVDRDEDSVFVVHSGTSLFLLDTNFTNPVTIVSVSNMNDSISKAIMLNNKLVIFDGKKTIIYGKFSDIWEAKYLTDVGYVPTTTLGRTPSGVGGIVYEDVNLIQSYRINSFLSDGSTATYKLDSKYDNEAPTATILQSNGTIANLTVLSHDKDNATVTFSIVPPISPVDGRDNVFVRFKVTNEETKSYIDNCEIVTAFGYSGNKNRIFATGNKKFPNVDWFCEVDNPLYFPANNYTRIGFQPIENYLLLNDGTLAVQKKISDTDASIYYRKSAIYQGQEVFPISSGVKTIGCISRHANDNLMNDPLTLTDLGIYAIVGTEFGEKKASERSYFVKNKLMNEDNLENAISITHKGKYYLAINGNVYVADSRYKSPLRDADNSDFQYEWYYWENVPVRIWFTHENELYFCTNDGKIAKFNNNLITVFVLPFVQIFDTSFLDLNSIVEAKTIKRVTVISRPYEDSEFKLSYMTDNDMSDITIRTFDKDDFPHTMQEKEKIKKFMFVKFRISSDKPVKLNFYTIGIDYVYAGHYRG